MSLDEILLLLIIIKILLGKKSLTNSPLESTWRKAIRNRILTLTNPLVLKDYLL